MFILYEKLAYPNLILIKNTNRYLSVERLSFGNKNVLSTKFAYPTCRNEINFLNEPTNTHTFGQGN